MQAGHHENANATQQVEEEGEEIIDFRFKRGRDRVSDVRTAILTVAVLLVTATYQAVISPPGGVWQDVSDKAQNTTQIKKVIGVSILGTIDKVRFISFMAGNTLGFLCSMSIIEDLTRGFARRVVLSVALFTISFSYGMIVYVITPPELQSAMTSVYFVVFVIFILVSVCNDKLLALYNRLRRN